MHKKTVRIFRQNQSMETCICCCILMILDYYHKLPKGMDHPTRSYENHLYSLLGYHLNGPDFDSRPRRFTRGTPLSAAASYLAEKGLRVTIRHEAKEYMDDLHWGTPYYPESVFPAILEKYRYWMEKPCKLLEKLPCERLTASLLTDILDGGALILAMCFMDGDEGPVLHGIILDRYRTEEGKVIFHVCNPATGRHVLDEDELLWRMNTPVGVHFLSVNESLNT